MRTIAILLLAAVAARAEESREEWLKQFAYEKTKFEAKVEERADRDTWKQLHVTFPSTTKTDVDENNTIHGHVFRPKSPNGVGVIVLPIWKGSKLDLEYMVGARLAKDGVTAFVMPLPYQFERAPKDERSGNLTLSSDIERDRGMIQQAVKDVKRCAQWLVESMECDGKRMGIMGTSLGGHVAALVWATDTEFKAGVTVLAGGNIHELFWNGSSETKEIKAELEAKGVKLADLAEEMKPYDAITYATKERKAGLLMIAAKDDPVVPIANVRALRDAFDHARLIVYPGNHYTVGLRIADILDDVSRHFAKELAK